MYAIESNQNSLSELIRLTTAMTLTSISRSQVTSRSQSNSSKNLVKIKCVCNMKAIKVVQNKLLRPRFQGQSSHKGNSCRVLIE